MQRFSGALLSPPDSRDYPARNYLSLGPIPTSYSPPTLSPIQNQGLIGCCVAESLALMKTYMENRERKTLVQYSIDFIYHNRLSSDHQGYGMYARQALSRLTKDGVCERKHLPSRTEYPSPTISAIIPALLSLAKPQTISSYVVCHNDTELKQAIYQNGAAVVVVETTQEFITNYKSTGGVGRYLKSQTPASFSFYHAMAAIGYEPNGVIVQNSFGTDWGDDGFAVLPNNYTCTKERWAVVDKIDKWDIVELWPGKRTARRNGVEMELDVAPQIIDGRTMVPLRFAGEALGAEVEWIQAENKVVIRKKHE